MNKVNLKNNNFCMITVNKKALIDKKKKEKKNFVVPADLAFYIYILMGDLRFFYIDTFWYMYKNIFKFHPFYYKQEDVKK